MILRYTVAWIFLVIVAITNAAIREAGYKKFLGELAAHQLSSLTAIILFGLCVWLLSLRWKLQSSAQALTVGLIWLVLTVAFEFSFGHFVMKNPWSRLLHDYNILEGRVWILVLVWILLAPLVVYKIRGQ
jgi:hypothetical protein